MSGQKTCAICQRLLPNWCNYASHQIIHQHKSPYTRPECRAICRSVHFQTHVTKNCLHYTKRVGFRCVHCNVVYSDGAALKFRIQGSHCEVLTNSQKVVSSPGGVILAEFCSGNFQQVAGQCQSSPCLHPKPQSSRQCRDHITDVWVQVLGVWGLLCT